MVSSSGSDEGSAGLFATVAVAKRPRPGIAASTASFSADPLVVFGSDLFFSNVLPRLDAPSLAACTAVCSAWQTWCTSDALWHCLLSCLLTLRAHIPLPLLRSPSPLSPYVAYSIIMLDAAKVEITPEEMCARIWEMKVKPTCGTYWYTLDPTSRNEDPLLRRFQCDHSVTAMQDMDPIWGGQESSWQVVKAKDRKYAGQCVQINSWPQHRVVRLHDGRWRLDNHYASYTTCPDQEDNRPLYVKEKLVGFCAECNPEPNKKEVEEICAAQKVCDN